MFLANVSHIFYGFAKICGAIAAFALLFGALGYVLEESQKSRNQKTWNLVKELSLKLAGFSAFLILIFALLGAFS